MGGGKVIVIYEDGNDNILDGKLTAPLVIICMAVASAGFMFGYSMSAFGGVTTMEPFLKTFFPSVLDRMRNSKFDQFCTFNTPELTSFISSMHVAAVISALIGGFLTSTAGRKGALIIGGILSLIGVFPQTLAVNLEMLILGRVITGFGIGFTNQAAPIYLSEMSPTRWRGAIGTSFHFFGILGVFTAFMTSYLLVPYTDNCWRIAIALSAFPTTIMTVIAFFIPDTPSSLTQRGKVEEALKSLNLVRSKETDTENELRYLVKYYEAVRNTSERSYQILLERRFRPHLVLMIAIPSFHQLTGINVNGGLGRMIFPSLGIGVQQTFLVQTLLVSCIILSIFTATFLVDRLGRRILLLQAGVQIFICHVIFAIVMANEYEPRKRFSKSAAIVGVFLTGFTSAAFTWSWGVLMWILPTELLPIEVRSSGQGLCIALNFVLHIITIHTTIPMLCHFKYGVFLYYAGWVLIMTIFMGLLLPETKRIPLESMNKIWHNHWYWHRFVDETEV